MAAFVRDVFVSVMARGRRAALILPSWKSTRAVRWRARGFGVVLPTSCFPSTDKRAAEAQVTAGSGARQRSSTLRAGQRVVPAGVAASRPKPCFQPGRVGSSMASDGKHDRARHQILVNPTGGRRHDLVHGQLRRFAPAPVANFRQVLATGCRRRRGTLATEMMAAPPSLGQTTTRRLPRRSASRTASEHSGPNDVCADGSHSA